MRNNEEKTFTKITIVIAVAIAIVALYFLMLSGNSIKTQSEDKSIGKAEIGGHFTLSDLDGNKFDSDSLQGKISLIYFGFTFCPDICPTALQKISSLLNDLAKYNIDVTPIFITLDPKRDTPDALKTYLGHFHPKLVGLTGSESEIKKVAADQFKVFYEIIPGSDKGNNDYLLDHSSFVYILDKNGEYAGHFHIETSEAEMLNYIRKIK